MGTLRSNIFTSVASMVVIGIARPLFNTVVTKAFGPEVNGHAARLLSMMFLFSLPATAGLPTVVVRHASFAFANGKNEEAKAWGRLGLKICGLLTAISVVAFLATARRDATFTASDLWMMSLALPAYAISRNIRGYMQSADHIKNALQAEVIGALCLPVTLGILVYAHAPEFVLWGFGIMYLISMLWMLKDMRLFHGTESLEKNALKEFMRFVFYWFIGTATSMAIREIAILVLNHRGTASDVGELSLALSLLVPLSFAPRVIELPLVHELASLSGKQDHEARNRIVTRSLDWMFILVFGLASGLAVLSAPLMAMAGSGGDTRIAIAFAIASICTGLELMQTPAANLIAAESRPQALAIINAIPFAFALITWSYPGFDPVLSAVFGIATSQIIKVFLFGVWMKGGYGLPIFPRPAKKIIAFLLSISAIVGTFVFNINSWLDVFILCAAWIALFNKELLQMSSLLIRPR